MVVLKRTECITFKASNLHFLMHLHQLNYLFILKKENRNIFLYTGLHIQKPHPRHLPDYIFS